MYAGVDAAGGVCTPYWVNGCLDTEGGRMTDRTAAPTGYNPDVLVDDVARSLRAKGIAARRDWGLTAMLAAADLLRALGVDPENMPERPTAVQAGERVSSGVYVAETREGASRVR